MVRMGVNTQPVAATDEEPRDENDANAVEGDALFAWSSERRYEHELLHRTAPAALPEFADAEDLDADAARDYLAGVAADLEDAPDEDDPWSAQAEHSISTASRECDELVENLVSVLSMIRDGQIEIARAKATGEGAKKNDACGWLLTRQSEIEQTIFEKRLRRRVREACDVTVPDDVFAVHVNSKQDGSSDLSTELVAGRAVSLRARYAELDHGLILQLAKGLAQTAHKKRQEQVKRAATTGRNPRFYEDTIERIHRVVLSKAEDRLLPAPTPPKPRASKKPKANAAT